MTDDTDEALLARFAAGDTQAFARLYQRHKGGLYRYFLRQTQSVAEAEDLFQDIWSKVIHAAAEFRPEAKFSTWLYTLAHNKLVDRVRHLKVVNKVMLEQGRAQPINTAESNNDPAADRGNSQIKQALKHCLVQLPQLQRECFLLKEEAGLAATDIAHIMDAGVEATKSRLRYAYQGLRQCLSVKLGKVVA